MTHGPPTPIPKAPATPLPHRHVEKALIERARAIRLLAMDVDGVLTDGSIMLDDRDVETKRFNVRDGQGISTWMRLGLDAAVITKRPGFVVQHRMRELGVKRIMQGQQNKAEALEHLLKETGVSAHEVAYVGDDWPDIAVLKRVGLSIAVGDADEHVKASAMLVTTQAGGFGAVREAVEFLLRAKGLMDGVIAMYSV